MRDLRIYMAVGGMPQAVEAYVAGKTFQKLIWLKDRLLLFMRKILKRTMLLEDYY